MARKQESGKGGNFDTRVNPFTQSGATRRSSADFTEVSDLGKALQVLVEAGCAAILGRTRDGGALVVTILDGEQRHRTYCSTAEELSEAVDAILDMYGEG